MYNSSCVKRIFPCCRDHLESPRPAKFRASSLALSWSGANEKERKKSKRIGAVTADIHGSRGHCVADLITEDKSVEESWNIVFSRRPKFLDGKSQVAGDWPITMSIFFVGGRKGCSCSRRDCR